ncbi:P-loop NTPase [Candidatus Micrarchaeota archaeon]|nr:P-loop NTPase [Candidatus Micrarchaeota archaeon]
MTSIVLASGKGGVGKSTITLNLGLVLAMAGKKVTVVDADIAMANLGLMLGIDRAPITLHNVLSGENDVLDAVYEGPNNLRYVPAGLSLDKVENVDHARLKNAVKTLDTKNDFVIVDSPPGLGDDALAAIECASEMILIVTQEPSSLADVLKVKGLAEKRGIKIRGLIINRSLNDKSEVSVQDIETAMNLPVLVIIPEDIEVRRSGALQVPVVVRAHNSPFSKSMVKLAALLLGQKIDSNPTQKRPGLFAGISAFFARLFSKKQ